MSRYRPISRASVVLALLAATLAAVPGQAGTEDDPDITDTQGDQYALLGGQQVSLEDGAATGADVWFGWIGPEPVGTDLEFSIQNRPTATFVSATHGPYTYEFHVSIGGTEYIASATTTATADSTTPGGVATASRSSGGILTLTVPLANLGDPAPGTVFTGLFIESKGFASSSGQQVTGDRAPDADFGRDYTLPAGGPDIPGDSDGDGLNDTFEETYFGDLNETGDGDPDQDGLNNTGEFLAGSDPTNPDTDGDGLTDGDEAGRDPPTNATAADSDGDGFNDKAELDAGTDPLDPNSKPAGQPTPPTTGTPVTPTTTPTSPTPGGNGTDEDEEVKTLEDAIDRVKDNPVYAAVSAAGLAAIILLSIIALAGRWRL